MKMKMKMKMTQTTQRTLSLILALALTFSLVFALSACAPKDDGGDTTPPPVSETPEAPPEEETPEETTPDVVTPEEEGDETPADNSEARGAIQTGAWDGDTFTNEWVNISFTLPEGWRAFNEEEIETQAGIGSNVLGVDASTQALQEATIARSAYDFVIAGPLYVPNIAAAYENISYSPLMANLDADEYFEIGKFKLADVGAVFGETTETQIAGETYYLCEASLAIVEDTNMYMRFYMRKLDGAVVMFTATFMSENLAEVDDFFASIVPAK